MRKHQLTKQEKEKDYIKKKQEELWEKPDKNVTHMVVMDSDSETCYIYII